MANIKAQLLSMKNYVVNELVDKISHTCTGIDINTCDPNKPMFGMGIKPIYEEKTE
jgi:hypothetical protein